MKPRWKVVAGIVTVTALSVGGMFAWARVDRIGFANVLGFNQSAKLIGTAIPGFSLREIHSGKTVTPGQLRGRVLVIAFWATWCPFCQKMLPALESLHNDPSLQNRVSIITIDVREEEMCEKGGQEDAVRAFLDASHYTFPVLLGGPQEMGAFRVQAVPAVIVADEQGIIRYAGITEHAEMDLRRIIEQAAVPVR